jgi:hypothetical protein
MELTVTTVLIAFAGVFLICFMKGAFGGGFSIVGIPLLSFVMDPVTAGGLLAPLFIAMDLFALRYWKPSTWSKPDLALLLPGLVIGIGLGSAVPRAGPSCRSDRDGDDHSDLCWPMACRRLGGEVSSAFVAKGDRCRSHLGNYHHGSAFRRTAACDVSVAARPQQASLCRNDESVLHCWQRDQGGAVVAAGETGGQRLDIDGSLPARHPHRCMAWLAASRKAGSASDLSCLLRIAGCDSIEIAVGRRFRLSRVNLDCEYPPWFKVLLTEGPYPALRFGKSRRRHPRASTDPSASRPYPSGQALRTAHPLRDGGASARFSRELNRKTALATGPGPD